MNRRDVLRAGIFGAAGAAAGRLFVPGPVLAATGFDPFTSPLAGSLYYTKARPGRWAKKAAGHLPELTLSGGKVKIVTPHPMSPDEHFIVKHMVLDENFRYVSETVFDPHKDGPISEHDVSGLKTVAYCISVCNLHDAWLAAISL